MGGTQFDEQSSIFWNVSNDPNGASVLSYIPEKVWNEAAAQGALLAGGGGASIVFPKPAWQTGPGVPSDGVRDLPDVALSSAGHDGYFTYVTGAAVAVSGTSAATPVFAGMLALISQYLVSTGVQSLPLLGNVNPTLYRVAANNPGVFHDIINGSNKVPCASASPDCSNGVFGYDAGPGYDLTTGLGSPDLDNLLHQWTTVAPKNSQVVVSLSRNPVYQQAPDQNGNAWTLTVTLTEEEGIPTTLTDFTINGKSSLAAFFPKTAIAAYKQISTTVSYKTLSVPANIAFGFTGVDADGRQWSRQVSVPFLGLPPAPTIKGIANGASYEQAFAPGMLLAVFGTNLGAAPQQAAAIPLISYMGRFSATINGFPCAVYYVSPGQVNLQIPYETAPGNATLTVSNGVGTASFTFQVAAAAPGVFMNLDGSRAAVPYASGNRGQTYTLFITGEGLVTPSLADGASPSAVTLVTALPKPRLPVSLSIGGVDAPVKFVGIPSGLVGVTQINFQVPATAPLGQQQVIVTVGGVPSAAVNFTVLP